MSEERICKTCVNSLHNNSGILCNKGGCFYSSGLPHYKSIDEYPKPATLLKAVEWMENGNKAICPHEHAIYLNSGWFKISEYSDYKISPRDVKEEWQLLAPDKSEPEIINHDDIRKELLSIKSEIDSILERMELIK